MRGGPWAPSAADGPLGLSLAMAGAVAVADNSAPLTSTLIMGDVREATVPCPALLTGGDGVTSRPSMLITLRSGTFTLPSLASASGGEGHNGPRACWPICLPKACTKKISAKPGARKEAGRRCNAYSSLAVHLLLLSTLGSTLVRLSGSAGVVLLMGAGTVENWQRTLGVAARRLLLPPLEVVSLLEPPVQVPRGWGYPEAPYGPSKAPPLV